MSSIASIVSTDLPSAVYRKITLRLLPFLTLCYMFAFLDRINIGFAKLQIQNALGFSDAVYGVGAGIFFIGYVLFEIPSNLLLPKIGARRTIARSPAWFTTRFTVGRVAESDTRSTRHLYRLLQFLCDCRYLYRQLLASDDTQVSRRRQYDADRPLLGYSLPCRGRCHVAGEPQFRSPARAAMA